MAILDTTPLPTPGWYIYWRAWKRAGSPYGKRPKHAPRIIPRWAWLQLKEDNRVRAENQRNSLWQSRGAWTAWGFSNGQFNPTQVAILAKAYAWRYIGVQDTAYNRSRRDEFKAAFKEHGVKLVVWDWATDANTTLALLDYWQPDGYSANVEHFGPWAELCDKARAKYPAMPMSVFTNFWGAGAVPTSVSPTGYSRADAEPFVRNDFAYITEAYMVNEQGDQPTLNPLNLEYTARQHLGAKYVYPCFGIYRCDPSYYSTYRLSFPFHSWYLLEYWPGL